MDINNAINSELKMIDRERISLTGIKKLISFDKEEFIMESSLGNISITGHGLELIKLDTIDGTLKIRGNINSIVYFDGKEKIKQESLLAKIFK